MSEPELPKPEDFKSITLVLWVALGTAILVTIIDWKIKQDILRLTDAFYRIYPTTMENEHERETKGNRPDNRGGVLPVSRVDHAPRMEARTAAEEDSETVPEKPESAWNEFNRLGGGVLPNGSGNTGSVSQGPVSLSRPDSE